jgi:2-amino-4-hydroxy-6-hydroxymethyldihydropteridine diphosphokinase
MATPVWIGLGSNLGDRRTVLDDAIAGLSEVPGVVVRAVSTYHETSPVGGPPGQGPFLNAAAHLETTLDPYQLLAVLQRIEDQAGRVRVVRWGERTLDLDILIFGTKFLDTKELKLPHPRLAFRRFVLAPLVEIAPNIVDTMTKRTIADLLANVERTPRLLALEGPGSLITESVFRRLVDDLPAFAIAEQDLIKMPDDDNDPFSSFSETIERKVNVLHSGFWAAETLRVSWIVADFSLGFDLSRAFSTNWLKGTPQEVKNSRKLSDHAKKRQLQVAATFALQATFVVILPSSEWKRRTPGVINIPLLRPESDAPDEIVAEVLATCRGIEGV